MIVRNSLISGIVLSTLKLRNSCDFSIGLFHKIKNLVYSVLIDSVCWSKIAICFFVQKKNLCKNGYI